MLQRRVKDAVIRFRGADNDCKVTVPIAFLTHKVADGSTHKICFVITVLCLINHHPAASLIPRCKAGAVNPFFQLSKCGVGKACSALQKHGFFHLYAVFSSQAQKRFCCISPDGEQVPFRTIQAVCAQRNGNHVCLAEYDFKYFIFLNGKALKSIYHDCVSCEEIVFGKNVLQPRQII
ncbi:MAG: hypothetical protein ACFWUD_00010 [Thermocaproicibacter melissae]